MDVTVDSRPSVHADAPAFFDGLALHYDSRYEAVDADGHALRARMRAVLRFAGGGPGCALDAGMGPGRLCAELAARGWTVSGIDASPAMVEVAGARIPDARDRLCCGRVEELPFADASFDLVTATGVLEYSDAPQALAELARVLRPGGRAVLSYPNPAALYGIWKTRTWYPAVRAAKRLLGRRHPELPRGAGPLPPALFTARLRAAGLVLERSAATSFQLLPTPADMLLPKLAARLGSRLEGRDGTLARRLATQVVYEARKGSR